MAYYLAGFIGRFIPGKISRTVGIFLEHIGFRRLGAFVVLCSPDDYDMET